MQKKKNQIVPVKSWVLYLFGNHTFNKQQSNKNVVYTECIFVSLYWGQGVLSHSHSAMSWFCVWGGRGRTREAGGEESRNEYRPGAMSDQGSSRLSHRCRKPSANRQPSYAVMWTSEAYLVSRSMRGYWVIFKEEFSFWPHYILS